ncbi:MULTISPECIES: DUF4013 domain-containing protein [Methanoculleus]|jgi:hypothetical protein|uniref:DUF4013 domain-containing protein n=1 Tax=Methanoculleus thermophilus TaxID=2200 RepID=A0A1G9C7I6_9EURY|nr:MULTISPECIES: DUF4013 domain-containing protein [Methanoculleus]NLN09213.1 DUF4013 domain-containing protein [Methanoculleus thermophilus]SDK47616.1 Protein of unknown function [Methanoculleus thermophilus]HQD26056.1 DUF4013 domain-containing protein [Methanoculleus thermophilus]
MDCMRLLSASFDYTKEALWGRWIRWFLLLIASIIFPLIYGYSVRVMSGAKPEPEFEGWIRLFIDGIKLLVISIVYSIPLIILMLLPLVLYLTPVSTTTTPAGASSGGLIDPGLGIFVALAFFVICILAVIVLGILATFAVVRFARTGRMREAFRFRAILAHIKRIGWLNVFVALLVLTVVITVAQVILSLIPIIGWLLFFLLTPAFIIFASRYLALLYESAPAPV